MLFDDSQNLQNLFTKRIFQDVPDEIDETWNHGVILGGIAVDYYTTFLIADAFKIAGDTLIDKVLSQDIEGDEMVYPILYNYRHSLELYLKSILNDIKGHDLSKLLEIFKKNVQEQLSQNLPDWFDKWVLEFDEFDKCSDMFRYADQYLESRHTGDNGEFWIDFVFLKNIMNLYQEIFHQIYNKSN